MENTETNSQMIFKKDIAFQSKALPCYVFQAWELVILNQCHSFK